MSIDLEGGDISRKMTARDRYSWERAKQAAYFVENLIG